jgi:hypothetical protein
MPPFNRGVLKGFAPGRFAYSPMIVAAVTNPTL